MSGVTTIDEMRRAVQMDLSHGVDWIKILATERAGTADTDPRKQVYREEAIRSNGRIGLDRLDFARSRVPKS